MPIDPNKLLALVGSAPEITPQPSPWGVLYSRPNPDASRKACGNCMMWASSPQRCQILPTDLVVQDEHICGYHVHGKPMEQLPEGGMVTPQDPELAGFEHIPGGTSCDTCYYFDGSSLCRAVSDPIVQEPPATVEPLGCCARWTPLGDDYNDG